MNLDALMNAGERVLLVGPPGIAKTARILQAAQRCGRVAHVWRMSLLERPDIGGCFVPDIAAGVTRALPLGELHALKHATVSTLLMLDDLGQAPMDVQAAAMKLFDEGELPACVTIWGATNRPSDRAGVSALCEPLRSRFSVAFAVAAPEVADSPDGPVLLQPWAHAGLQCDGCEVCGWCEWALDQGAAAEIVAWHRSTSGRTLYQWRPHSDPAIRMPDYRSWHTVLRLWQQGERSFSMVAGAVGKPVAAEFTAFASLADKLPTPQQVQVDPTGALVPQAPAPLYYIATALPAALAPDWIDAFVAYIERLPRVYQALAGRDALRRLGGKFSGTRAGSRWFAANSALFSVGGAK
jgi:hypothetical protein